MLAPERYQQVIAALEQLHQSRIGWNQCLKQTLMDEQLRTTYALARLDTKTFSEIFLPQEQELKPAAPEKIFIEIIGMPHAGKTPLSFRTSTDLGLDLIKENVPRAKALAKAGRESGLIPPADYYSTIEVLKSGLVAREILQTEDSKAGKPKIIDRGGLDPLVFTRAQFLFGRLKGKTFQTQRDFFHLRLNLVKPEETEYRYGFVICLISPTLSLEREGPREEPGEIMNSRFLQIIYEQYLRLYQELQDDGRFPFICLDTSGDWDGNQRKFNQAVQEMINYFIR